MALIEVPNIPNSLVVRGRSRSHCECNLDCELDSAQKWPQTAAGVQRILSKHVWLVLPFIISSGVLCFRGRIIFRTNRAVGKSINGNNLWLSCYSRPISSYIFFAARDVLHARKMAMIGFGHWTPDITGLVTLVTLVTMFYLSPVYHLKVRNGWSWLTYVSEISWWLQVVCIYLHWMWRCRT